MRHILNKTETESVAGDYVQNILILFQENENIFPLLFRDSLFEELGRYFL